MTEENPNAGAPPTNGISTEFEIGLKFRVL